MIRFTALGTGTIALSPARRCAGYLLECGAVRLLLDCGPGIAHRMAELGVEWRDITHVAITHFHLDHHLDLPLLLFAWRHGMLPARSAPLRILGPPGITGLLERTAALHGAWVHDPGYPIEVTELARDGRADLGHGVSLEAFPVPHTDESVAYSMGCGGRRLVYTGDTGHSPELAAWAHGADLLVAECSLPQPMAIPGHLTPELCGQLGNAARPQHLVLTHLYPPVEAVDIVAAVRRHFDGPLSVAHDGWTTTLEDG
jgi:ribonuclease BN (tRNA processing enzyme)